MRKSCLLSNGVVLLAVSFVLLTRADRACGESPPSSATVSTAAQDLYRESSPANGAENTADEPMLATLSLSAAADYLDQRAHLAEDACYACHSTFSHLPARSALDPLCEEVMRSRVLLERFVAMCADPTRRAQVTTLHVNQVRVLAAVELARHDAVTTGHLQTITRQALDAVWELQRDDGGLDWLHVGEAPQAVDDYWPVAMLAQGVGAAPDHYASSSFAQAGIEKLRGWFRSHPPSNAHERGLTLIADASIGGILSNDTRREHMESLLRGQLADGGWSLAGLAPWERPDKQSLDATRSDGYGTAFVLYAVARGGATMQDDRVRAGVAWLKSHQRRSGGWFTPSPFKRDAIASNTGTSMAIQALAALGEIPPPRGDSGRFAPARAAAEQSLAEGVFVPNP